MSKEETSTWKPSSGLYGWSFESDVLRNCVNIQDYNSTNSGKENFSSKPTGNSRSYSETSGNSAEGVDSSNSTGNSVHSETKTLQSESTTVKEKCKSQTPEVDNSFSPDKHLTDSRKKNRTGKRSLDKKIHGISANSKSEKRAPKSFSSRVLDSQMPLNNSKIPKTSGSSNPAAFIDNLHTKRQGLDFRTQQEERFEKIRAKRDFKNRNNRNIYVLEKENYWFRSIKIVLDELSSRLSDEAIARLLSSEGKDAYSILGLKWNASDEDIKKYYRKQAVLVHPDKNAKPGAETAFKILGQAFEMIGSSTARRAYDTQMKDTEQRLHAQHNLEDLLDKLKTKLGEAANTMRCSNCCKAHKRIPTTKSKDVARYCSGCRDYHSATDGDVWAETRLVFIWHYYWCVDGCVYDITDYAQCNFSSMKAIRPNSHIVQLKMGFKQKRPNNKFDDFLRDLYERAGTTNDNNQPQQPQQQQHQDKQKKKKKGKRR
ncbi:DgyrCDS7046 [Dimorphilus gyrociliatus]|uniref:DgyrCDS7046 n=1 Tax=Dimorphilus gyrociliatus TaxID=2664684 RepID=A0A7I8VPW8_9ANNE|nr:DgyrCDS7046 [Dimorphilus gyrociliatus]